MCVNAHVPSMYLTIFASGKKTEKCFMKNLGKILIVDDNEDVLFALNLLLEPYAEMIRVAKVPEK